MVVDQLRPLALGSVGDQNREVPQAEDTAV